MQHVNKNPSASELRRFGLITAGGFAALGTLLWWVGRSPVSVGQFAGSGEQWTALALWSAGAGFALVCFMSQWWARRLYVIWMTGAMYLGAVSSTILLSILFVVLLPAFSLIRLTDPLRLRLKGTDSYWEAHTPHEPTLERMLRPF